MLEEILLFHKTTWSLLLTKLLIIGRETVLLYVVLFYITRSILRKFESDDVRKIPPF